jgi:hypothetical protein
VILFTIFSHALPQEYNGTLQDERPFGVLYADIPSRPNIPVNALVGLESLKAGFGWSDEEMYDAFTYDMQVRYALGYNQLGEGDFDLRSLYYFRERVSRYRQEKGINLIEKAFEQVTNQQIKANQIKTGKQRMDSTQIASNMREMSRLQLLVEILQRVHRMLKEEDQKGSPFLINPFPLYPAIKSQKQNRLSLKTTSPIEKAIFSLKIGPSYTKE